jgi:hypothetical protein
MADKVTKAHVLALARKRHGLKAQLREDKNAPTAESRAELLRLAVGRHDRKNSLQADLKAAGTGPYMALLKAARFALDVDGDEPSWSQLRAATEAMEDFAAKYEELRHLQELISKSNTHRYRWSVIEVGSLFVSVHEQADTLEELATKLK